MTLLTTVDTFVTANQTLVLAGLMTLFVIFYAVVVFHAITNELDDAEDAVDAATDNAEYWAAVHAAPFLF